MTGLSASTTQPGPRTRLIEEPTAPLLARPYFASGDPGPIVASLAQVPELLGPTLPFLGSVLGPSWIPLRDKEIVILRTSAVMGCRYCTDAHSAVARLRAHDLAGPGAPR